MTSEKEIELGDTVKISREAAAYSGECGRAIAFYGEGADLRVVVRFADDATRWYREDLVCAI